MCFLIMPITLVSSQIIHMFLIHLFIQQDQLDQILAHIPPNLENSRIFEILIIIF